MTYRFRLNLPTSLSAISAALLLVYWLTAAAETGPEAATDQVKVRLIAATSAVRPGDELWIGLHQDIIPHWHTYWINPGDSGLATKIQYQLPPSWSVGDIQWPTPSKFVLGPVVNSGYRDSVTLLSPLKVAEDAAVGSEQTVTARAKWLVCEEICIPQQADLVLRLPVIAKGTPVETANPLITEAQATWPRKSPWLATLLAKGNGAVLRLSSADLAELKNRTLTFYPEQWGLIAHGAAQPLTMDNDAVEIGLQPGDQPLAAGQSLAGVLAVGDGTDARGYRIVASWPALSTLPASVETAVPESVPALPQSEDTGDISLPLALILALAGGVILNLMPCVFPVLSLKALAVLEQANHEPRKTRLHGWTYTAGILASFAGLAGILMVLKAGGAGIGWGFQFQSPAFVLTLAYLIFAIGLSLSGILTVGASIAGIGIGSGWTARGGYSGSFFTGMLAAVVATPCTAPFMGAAIGYAVTQPGLAMLAVFLSLGTGLALPYWLLCHWPALQRWLPKPGAWLETLKQALAFPMYATAAWLVWVLARQSGPEAVAASLAGCVAIALAAWWRQVGRNAGDFVRRLGTTCTLLLLALAISGGYAIVQTAIPTGKPAETGQEWQTYSPERLAELRAANQPVFVNFTADWCITCLVNEKVALSSDSVQRAFREHGVTYLKGDWTNRDETIAKVPAEYGRSGVPLYLYFPPGAQSATVLPQLLTPDLVIGTLTGAHS